jgi:hypothetical protein
MLMLQFNSSVLLSCLISFFLVRIFQGYILIFFLLLYFSYFIDRNTLFKCVR